MLVYDVSTTYQQHVRKKANKEAPSMSSMDTTGLNDLSEKYYGKSIS
jgi:hypothetical protein